MQAFRKTVPPKSFKKLSEGFVIYAGGLPLALKVLGSSLYSRTDVLFWKAHLKKVRVNPLIHEILKLSYDELVYETEKDIFLDIAFFFVGRDKDEAVHIFNSCGFLPDAGIQILVERCLLTIDKNNNFQMHNLIQDMGMELGKSKGLFWRGNEWEDLQNHKGTDKIEGVIIDLTMSTERQMSAKIFERLPNLRLLEIIGTHNTKGNYKKSFSELRCIRWPHCPWTRLPSDFRPPKLVSLDMPFSKFKILWKDVMVCNILWKDVMPLVSLKTIDLSYSQKMRTTPDFTDLKTVEKLLLHGCRNLLEVHPSIGQLTNLGDLDLSGCVKLELLPNSIQQLTKLGRLNLNKCFKLKQLPEQLGDMKGLQMLDASWSGIQQLPDSIGHLKNLVELKLHFCIRLNKLPEQLGDMEGLRRLDASGTPIQQLPNSICKLKLLKVLNLRHCHQLERLPQQLGEMQSLQELDLYKCLKLEYLPDSIGPLSRLQVLNLNGCLKLE